MRPILVIVDDEADVLSSVQQPAADGLPGRHFSAWSRSPRIPAKYPASARDSLGPADARDDGVEVLRQAMAIRPETTRLLFTAYADIRTVIDAINEGHVFRYLAKPFDPD